MSHLHRQVLAQLAIEAAAEAADVLKPELKPAIDAVAGLGSQLVQTLLPDDPAATPTTAPAPSAPVAPAAVSAPVQPAAPISTQDQLTAAFAALNALQVILQHVQAQTQTPAAQ